MLSIAKLSGGAGEIERYLTGEKAARGAEDYYSAEGMPGQWLGGGAEAMGLIRHKKEDFIRLLEGRDPASGEPLARQGGAARRRMGYDLTFSAPKSVSAIWAVAGAGQKKEIEAAQQRAVRAAVDYAERIIISSRRGKGGAESDPAKMVAAMYQHGTSRGGDPDLHTHCAVLNAALRPDGTWGSLDARAIYEHKMALGAIYRAELAQAMREQGYEIEADGDSFKVAGVPAALCEHWSSRRKEVVAAMAAAGTSGARAAEVAALSSRRAKEPATPLQNRWAAEAAQHGFAPKNTIYSANDLKHPQDIDKAALLQKLTQSQSIFQKKDLIRWLAVEAQTAGGGLRRVEAMADDLLKSKEIVRLRAPDGKPYYTTQEMREIEKKMAATAQTSATDTRHAVPPAAVDAALADFARRRGFSLSAEQQAAVRHLVEEPGSIKMVQGGAGTGKSTMADAARMAWESQGFRVRGAALAGKAAQGLEDAAGIAAQTLHSLLAEMEEGKTLLGARDIVVLDEAGMVGSRQMARLIDHTSAAGAKIVLIGDARQLQAIDAGGAFRLLQGSIGFARLDEIRRQRDGGERRMVAALADGRAGEALRHLAESGRLHTAKSTDSAIEKMVERWAETRDPARPGEALMMAGTRAEVRKINDLARARMDSEGRLSGPETTIGGAVFQAGDRILFTRNSKILGVKNGEIGTIRAVQPLKNGGARITVERDGGGRITFYDSEYEHVAHGYATSVHKAQGATIDKAFVLAGEMSDREWGYVAGSRHRESLEIFMDEDTAEEIESDLKKSRAKGTSMDFEVEIEREEEEHDDEMEMR